ncbi:MAG: hypothetical protein D6782_10720, partial [Alphaproteobacteria bacterium]
MTERPVTDVATTPLEVLLDPAPGRRMAMKGFDPEFVDIADYIIRITDRIWHQKRVEDCRKYYAPDALIHTLAGDVKGVQAVIDGTHQTLHSFPDRYLNPDNVVWSGNETDGFYSSHRLTSLMTNLGDTAFGPATGKRLRVPAIADCVVRENRIVEEWLVRDNMGLVRQLGFDIGEAVAGECARSAAQADAVRARDAGVAAQVRATACAWDGALPAPEETAHGFAVAVLAWLWHRRDLARLEAIYDHRARVIGPGNRACYGRAEWADALAQIQACLHDARVRVDHVACLPYLGQGRDIAVRWSLAGRHAGAGLYGPPTGADVWLLGISHWRVINGRIHDEWTLFDEFALLTQIARS